MNLASIIDPHPDDAVALVSRTRTTTYGELRGQVAALRGGLAGLGLEPGDRVAVVCANNWYFVVSYLAVLGAGLVAVPLNPLSPPAELEASSPPSAPGRPSSGPRRRATFDRVDRGAAEPRARHRPVGRRSTARTSSWTLSWRPRRRPWSTGPTTTSPC